MKIFVHLSLFLLASAFCFMATSCDSSCNPPSGNTNHASQSCTIPEIELPIFEFPNEVKTAKRLAAAEGKFNELTMLAEEVRSIAIEARETYWMIHDFDSPLKQDLISLAIDDIYKSACRLDSLARDIADLSLDSYAETANEVRARYISEASKMAATAKALREEFNTFELYTVDGSIRRFKIMQGKSKVVALEIARLHILVSEGNAALSSISKYADNPLRDELMLKDTDTLSSIKKDILERCALLENSSSLHTTELVELIASYRKYAEITLADY